MKKYFIIYILLAAAFLPVVGQTNSAPQNPFKNLMSFIGKTWRGEFKNSTPEKPVEDISKWELTLNGKAVRILHSVNNGEYGGETIAYWDSEREELIYYYFTTAGFYTTGTLKIEDGIFTSHEFVKGNENGITEVEATAKILPDGRLHTKSKYLQNGVWVEDHEVFYTEDASAEVKFKGQ